MSLGYIKNIQMTVDFWLISLPIIHIWMNMNIPNKIISQIDHFK